jgi:hypothetical protein
VHGTERDMGERVQLVSSETHSEVGSPRSAKKDDTRVTVRSVATRREGPASSGVHRLALPHPTRTIDAGDPRDRAPIRGHNCSQTHSHAAAAPRGALLYPRLSREELEGRVLGLMADLDGKPEGNNSMPGK